CCAEVARSGSPASRSSSSWPGCTSLPPPSSPPATSSNAVSRSDPRLRPPDMKYMLLIYNNPEAMAELPEAELNGIYAEVGAIMEELTASGELLGGEALAHPSQTKTGGVRDGGVQTHAGRCGEAKEQFAATLMIDVESEARAVEIAARWPDARS